jgi:hypothetical protein
MCKTKSLTLPAERDAQTTDKLPQYIHSILMSALDKARETVVAEGRVVLLGNAVAASKIHAQKENTFPPHRDRRGILEGLVVQAEGWGVGDAAWR